MEFVWKISLKRQADTNKHLCLRVEERASVTADTLVISWYHMIQREISANKCELKQVVAQKSLNELRLNEEGIPHGYQIWGGMWTC